MQNLNDVLVHVRNSETKVQLINFDLKMYIITISNIRERIDQIISIYKETKEHLRDEILELLYSHNSSKNIFTSPANLWVFYVMLYDDQKIEYLNKYLNKFKSTYDDPRIGLITHCISNNKLKIAKYITETFDLRENIKGINKFNNYELISIHTFEYILSNVWDINQFNNLITNDNYKIIHVVNIIKCNNTIEKIKKIILHTNNANRADILELIISYLFEQLPSAQIIEIIDQKIINKNIIVQSFCKLRFDPRYYYRSYGNDLIDKYYTIYKYLVEETDILVPSDMDFQNFSNNPKILSYLINDLKIDISQENIEYIINVSHNLEHKNDIYNIIIPPNKTISFDCFKGIAINHKINRKLLLGHILSNLNNLDNYPITKQFFDIIVSLDLENAIIHFIDKINNNHEGYFDIFIKYKNNLTSEQNINIYQKFSHNININQKLLIKACFKCDYQLISCILDNKVIPNDECYNALFIKSNMNKHDISDIIDLLIIFGYQIKRGDILLATKNKIQLAQEFPDFIPDEIFYGYCDINFQPRYNDNMYTDVLWFERLLEISRIETDYGKIIKFVKKYDITPHYNHIEKLGNLCQCSGERGKNKKKLYEILKDKI